MNLVAFVTSDKEWPSDVHLTLPATREEALEDFKDFGPNVLKLIGMTKEKPERVSTS
jgi:salicylate hydroxylase